MGIVYIIFFTFFIVLYHCKTLNYAHSPYESTSNIFDVRVLGAIGDGVADDTQAFVTAWGYACQSQSSTVLVPKGYTFMVKSIIFAGPCQFGLNFEVCMNLCILFFFINVNFDMLLIFHQIEGVIVPPDGPESWTKNTSFRKWLVFFRANGLIVSGDGVIDGRGEKWWSLPCKPHRVSILN